MEDITKITPLSDEDKETLKTLKKKGIVFKGISKAFSTFLVLWLLSKKDMHGYMIMKKIDEFFKPQIEHEIMKSTKANKIYPLLKSMKENNLIDSYEGLHMKKEVKIYKLTEEGEKLFKLIKKDYINSMNNSIWEELLNDLDITIK